MTNANENESSSESSNANFVARLSLIHHIRLVESLNKQDKFPDVYKSLNTVTYVCAKSIVGKNTKHPNFYQNKIDKFKTFSKTHLPSGATWIHQVPKLNDELFICAFLIGFAFNIMAIFMPFFKPDHFDLMLRFIFTLGGHAIIMLYFLIEFDAFKKWREGELNKIKVSYFHQEEEHEILKWIEAEHRKAETIYNNEIDRVVKDLHAENLSLINSSL